MKIQKATKQTSYFLAFTQRVTIKRVVVEITIDQVKLAKKGEKLKIKKLKNYRTNIN